MKKITSLMLALVMNLVLCVPAFAAENEFPTDTVYDDYLTETVTRGIKVPSADKVWDFSEGRYDGVLDRIRTGIYTNYCFYPNSSGKLTFGWTVRGESHLVETTSWKVLVGIYDMSEEAIIETKGGDFHPGEGVFYTESVTFSGLDTNTKYCFFISVYNEARQIWGNCWVSQ